MLSFDDPRWTQLRGGYRAPYDARKALAALERGTDVSAAWSELWEELHHQGDVGEASYAAVPHLVRIHGERDAVERNTYALAVVIEQARQEHENPQMPSWLADAYDLAWLDIVKLGLRDLRLASEDELINPIIAALSFGKGMPMLGRMAMLTGARTKADAGRGWVGLSVVRSAAPFSANLPLLAHSRDRRDAANVRSQGWT